MASLNSLYTVGSNIVKEEFCKLVIRTLGRNIQRSRPLVHLDDFDQINDLMNRFFTRFINSSYRPLGP